MSKDDENRKYHENSMKYWRSWGSWFSWGSPIGLILFFNGMALFAILVRYAILMK